MAALHHHQPFLAAAAKTNLITNTATGKPPYPTPPLQFRFFSKPKQTEMQGGGGCGWGEEAEEADYGAVGWFGDVERVTISCRLRNVDLLRVYP
jgi:hypothetical protein